MSQYSTNFLLLPIPEYPVLDCAPNKIIKLVVLGGSSVGKTGKAQVCSLLVLAAAFPSSFAAQADQNCDISCSLTISIFFFFFLRKKHGIICEADLL